MKRIAIFVLIALSATTRAKACDVCGCSASNQYLGVLPQFYRHFAGLQYQYKSFESNHPSLFEGKPDEHSVQYYNTTQLWGRYYVGKRVQLFGFLPYQHNVMIQDGVKTTTSGIGDISALANIVLIRRDSNTGPINHSLIAGGGVKLPTGKYTGIMATDRQGLPNMQAGTGSWDFVVNANYTARYKKVGINADVAYTLTTVNRENYKYGNRLNTGLLAFLWLQKNNVSFVPQAGARFEQTLHDYDNYERKWLNEQSGGSMVFGTIGFQAYYKRLGMQVNYALPLVQHYAQGYVQANNKLETGVFFLF